jgi:hypothetical protein
MQNNFFKKIISIIAFFILFFSFAVYASDLTSTNFIIRDPVVGTGGSYGTSTNFKLFSSGNPSFSGTGSSTNFIGRYGFLYFPFINVGTLTAVQDGIDADLSWPASTAGLGYNVSGYNTGVASVSGGPYTYTNVGNVTSYTYSSLEPGEYCFVVQTLDAFSNVIGISNEDCVTITPVLVFDIDTGVADGETNSPYSVSLGTITTSDNRVSGTTDSINMIILEGMTNAPSGVAITVKNANGSNGLVSSSNPGSNINSADGTMSVGTENYGLCVITATISGFIRVSPYNSDTCATNSHTNGVQGLTTTGENILSSNGTTLADGHAEVSVNAGISSSTPAHSDYTDTLTFIATATF